MQNIGQRFLLAVELCGQPKLPFCAKHISRLFILVVIVKGQQQPRTVIPLGLDWIDSSDASTQCDQIGQFIRLWAPFQSLWKQLICPNLQYSKAIFVKVSKSIIFLVISFLGNFYRHLATFTGHTASTI